MRALRRTFPCCSVDLADHGLVMVWSWPVPRRSSGRPSNRGQVPVPTTLAGSRVAWPIQPLDMPEHGFIPASEDGHTAAGYKVRGNGTNILHLNLSDAVLDGRVGLNHNLPL
jgi:hypothetical protein